MKITRLSETPEQGVIHNSRIRKLVLLKNNDILNLTNYSQARFSIYEIAPANKHDDMYEVFFIQSGQGEISCKEKNLKLEAGVCITIASKSPRSNSFTISK